MPAEPDQHQTTATVAMAPDCTIRSIAAAHDAMRHAISQQAPAGVLSIDCTAVEQADITFIQLLISASKTSALRNIHLALHAPPPCVREALTRAGIDPHATPSIPSPA